VLVDLRVECGGRSRHETKIGVRGARDSLKRGIEIPRAGDAPVASPKTIRERL
jgi:hypothetical protein